MSQTFDGPDAEEQEALKAALELAAHESAPNSSTPIYDYLEGTPKTSLVVELVDSLHRLGFKITRQRPERPASPAPGS